MSAAHRPICRGTTNAQCSRLKSATLVSSGKISNLDLQENDRLLSSPRLLRVGMQAIAASRPLLCVGWNAWAAFGGQRRLL